MNTLFWMFVPDEALPLLIMASGVLLMLGFREAALSLFLGALLLPVLTPVVEGLLGQTPPWVSTLILAVVVLTVLRALASVFLGQRAADHMVGILAADAVRFLLVCMGFPFRLLGRACRALMGGRV